MKTCPRPLLRASVLACCLSAPTASFAQDADRILGPIRLVRPLSPHTIEMLYKEADSAYRGERWTAAMQGFRTLIGYDPAHGRAWFRIGNLHQQRRQYVAAAGAYRRASAAIDPTAPDVPAADATVRNKALLNLALVNAELARDALTQVEPSNEEEAGVLNEVRADVGEVHDEARRRTRAAVPEPTARDWRETPSAYYGAAPVQLPERAGIARRQPVPEVPAGYPESDQVRPRSVGRSAASSLAPAPMPAPVPAPASASWSRRPAAQVPAAVDPRAPGPGFLPAAAPHDRPLLRTSLERAWPDRYDDEPEVRPQIEYLRGAPRQ